MDKSILGMFYIVVYLSSAYAFVCLLRCFFQFIGLMPKNKGHFFDRGNGGLNHSTQSHLGDDNEPPLWYQDEIYKGGIDSH